MKDEFVYNVFLNHSNKKPDLSFLAQDEAFPGNPTVRSANATAHGSKKSDAGSVPKPSDEIKTDPEAFARRSVVSRVIDGDAEERESALVALVAERALRHGPKPDAIKTIARIGLELGLKTVDASRIIKKGEALADRVRGTSCHYIS